MVDSLYVSDCVNTTIFCSAVKRVSTLTNCENVTFTAASGIIRVGNCVDCVIYSYSHYGAPIIYGDTRNLSLAPHNAGFAELNELLIKGGINLQA